jgi:hypothetical protein
MIEQQHQETEQNKRLKSKFDFEKYGFYSVLPFIDTQIGFGCKKKLNPQDTENISGIGIYIPRKAFYATATYGKKLAEGIQMRKDQKPFEPLDLEFRDEFFYDTATEKIYKGTKEIEANEMLLEIYNKHIKTTRPIRGFFLRLKLGFWRVLLPWLFTFVSSIFHYLLLLISGDRYTYDFLFQEEKENGQIISSRMEGHVNRSKAEVKEEDKEAKKIDFFGNKVPQWSIVFYSALHLCVWFVFKYREIRTEQIEDFFSNNFLVVLYVIVSFWLLETILPLLLKKMIKYSSTLSFLASHKKIHV